MAETPKPVIEFEELQRELGPEKTQEARRIARSYQVLVKPTRSGKFLGHGIEMPGVIDVGPSPEECVAKVYQALEVTVAAMMHRGETPPPAEAY